jgi:predicted GIY-YIG superfamily endonuclease
MDYQDKQWYLYLILTKTLIKDENMIYIGITTSPEQRYYDHVGTNHTTIIKNYTKGVLEYHVLPIQLDKMRRQYAEILETLLACIIKYNYSHYKVYGGVFNRIDCDITHDKIIEKFKDVHKNKYDSIFYKYYNDFIRTVIEKNIKIGNHNLYLFMPVETDKSGDVIMWNS